MLIEDNFRKIAKRTGIVAVNHPGYVEAMFSCLEAGEIVIPLRGEDDRDRIQAAGVEQIITPTGNASWMSRSFRASHSNETALIAFTSGTEGTPKGVMLSHRNLATVIDRLNSLMRVDDSIREYVGVPVYHSFGFGRCRAVSTAGGQFFIPSNGFNPAEISAMLKAGEINAISAVPSLWRVLLANQDLIGSVGRRVQWIEIGSQYMSRAEKEALKRLFPEARIVQHYGLTEASRTTLLEIHETEGDALESVGRALDGVSVRLTSEGQIAIRGEHVAQNYLIDDREFPTQDDSGWLLTKDLGRFENGYLYYEGRADDVINCGGIKVHPEALETKIFAQIGYTQGLAVCRKLDPIRGEGFLVAVTKEVAIAHDQLRDVVLQATQSFGVNAGNAIAIVEVEHLPKTATGKVQRKKLSEEFAQLGSEIPDAIAVQGTPIQKAFCRALNISHVKPPDNFVSLGGDSLSYVQLLMELERHLGYLPKHWELLSIADLEKLTPQHHTYAPIETSVFMRALAISAVVGGHAGFPSIIGGGSTLLLLIAGENLARFQSQALFQGRFLQPIASLLKNLLVPYLVVAGAYLLWKRDPDISVLLMFSNFVSPFVNAIFPVWFIDLLVQLIVGISLLFGVRSIRTFARVAPWKFGLGLLAVGVLANRLIPLVWDTRSLFDRLPHNLGWVFVMGWVIQFASDRMRKGVTAALLSALSLVLLFGAGDSQTWWLILGGNLLIWLPDVSVPRLIKSPLQMLSAAAYYIYLTHMIFIHVVNHTVGEVPWLSEILALSGGVAIWYGVQSVQQWWAKRRGVNRIELSGSSL